MTFLILSNFYNSLNYIKKCLISSASDYVIEEKTAVLQKRESEGFGFVLRGAKGRNSRMEGWRDGWREGWRSGGCSEVSGKEKREDISNRVKSSEEEQRAVNSSLCRFIITTVRVR